jgi:hypothetical protein
MPMSDARHIIGIAREAASIIIDAAFFLRDDRAPSCNLLQR